MLDPINFKLAGGRLGERGHFSQVHLVYYPQLWYLKSVSISHRSHTKRMPTACNFELFRCPLLVAFTVANKQID